MLSAELAHESVTLLKRDAHHVHNLFDAGKWRSGTNNGFWMGRRVVPPPLLKVRRPNKKTNKQNPADEATTQNVSRIAVNTA